MNSKTLSLILAVDAATCAAVFGFGVLATRPVAALTGLPEPIVGAGGWICLAAGALLAWLAARASAALLWLAIAGNIAWVVASMIVWAAYFPGLTPIGHAIVAAQAIGVAIFVLLESRGARALGTGPLTA